MKPIDNTTPEEVAPVKAKEIDLGTNNSWTLSDAEGGGEQTRCFVAGNPRTPPEMLDEMSKDDCLDVRRSVAWNRAAPEAVLRRLAKDSDPSVRQSVAGNMATPSDLLKELAGDGDFAVVRAVGWNPNADVDTLAVMAEAKERNRSGATVRATSRERVAEVPWTQYTT